MIERIGDRGDVALVVVGVLRGLVLRAEFLGETVQVVEDAASRLREGVGRVGHLLLRAVAHRIERVGDAVAEVVGHARQAMRGVVGIGKERPIGQRDLGELPYAVVAVAGDLSTNVARSEPFARIVAERGGEPVRIDDGERLAVGVVGGDLSHMTQRIRDRRDVAGLAEVCIAIGVISGGRDVRHVGAWTVHRQHRSVRVVGGAPGARRAGRRCAESRGASSVRRRLDRFRARHAGNEGYAIGLESAARPAVAVVDVARDAQRLGDLRLQPERRVPLRADGARLRRAEGLGARGLQIARQVVGVIRDVAVPVGA